MYNVVCVITFRISFNLFEQTIRPDLTESVPDLTGWSAATEFVIMFQFYDGLLRTPTVTLPLRL